MKISQLVSRFALGSHQNAEQSHVSTTDSQWDGKTHGSLQSSVATLTLNPPKVVKGHGATRKITTIVVEKTPEILNEVPAIKKMKAGTQVGFDLDETLLKVDGTPAMLKTLQKKTNCFALTARPFLEAMHTRKLLLSQDFDLGKTAPWSQPPKVTLPNAGYLDGVVYCSGGNMKGDLMPSLLDHNPNMKHLVFVDDNAKNFAALALAVSRMKHGPSLTCVWLTETSPETEARRPWYNEFAQAIGSGKAQVLEQHDANMRALPIGGLPNIHEDHIEGARRLQGTLDKSRNRSVTPEFWSSLSDLKLDSSVIESAPQSAAA